MALSRVKTWSSGETLTASDLNAEFNNILNNPVSLVSPLTGAIDLNGQELIFDADADTSITADSDDVLDFKIAGTDGFFIGHGTGNTVGFLHVDPGAFSATATTDIGLLRIGNSNAVTVPSGTTAVAAGIYVEAPNWTATGTITNTASLYIAGAATEGSNDYAVWVDDGAVQIDSTLTVGGTVTLTTDLGVASGGTGASTHTDGGLLIGKGTAAFENTGVLADGTIVVGDGTTNPATLAAFSSSTGTLNVAKGGTGASTLTDGGILLGSGTNAVTAMSVLADGNIVIGDGTTDPVALAAFSSSTGTLKVANGGTGASTLTDGGVLLGSGTNAVTATAVLADGEMLVGDGTTDPALESGDTLRTSIMGAIGPDLNTLGAVSSDSEFIVGTGSGAFAYESGGTLRTSVGVGTTDSPQFTSLTLTGFEYLSMTTGITAGTTQSQAGATALTTQTNRVTASGSDSDAVKLPTAVANALITVINDDAAQTIAVWPNTGDTIDGESANAVDPNTLAAGNSRTYLAYDATNWVTVTNAPSAGFDPDGAQVFNDSGADVDFRIESSGNANFFIVDASGLGGEGSIGIGQTPDSNNLVTLGNEGAQSNSANQLYNHLYISAAANTTIPSGTCAMATSLRVKEPLLTATGTVTYAASVFIDSEPTEGTNNSALRVDGDVHITHTNGQAALLIGPATQGTSGLSAGVFINQVGSDDYSLALESSGDVAHGMTSYYTTSTTGTYAGFNKSSATEGGLRIFSIAENGVGVNFNVQALGGSPHTSASTSNSAAMRFAFRPHDNSNGAANAAAGAMVVAFSTRVGGSDRQIFFVDEDGEIFSDETATVATFDQYDDMAAAGQFDLMRATEFQPHLAKMMSPSRYDGNAYTREHFEGMKILGTMNDIYEDDTKDIDGNIIPGRLVTVAEQVESGHAPHVSQTGLARLNRGAWRQAHQLFDCIIQCMEDRDPGYKAALREHLVHCDLPTQILDWEGDHDDSPLHDIVDPGPIPPDRGIAPPPPAFNE